MFKLKFIFVPLATLLLAACNANSTPAPVQTSSVEPTPTEKTTSMPTEAFQSTSTPPTEPTPTGESTTVPSETFQPTSTPAPDSSGEKPSHANADVIHVRAVSGEDGTWAFYVTVAHPDSGWEDYADGWDVVTPDGIVLKVNPDDPFTRLLLHPHENEQPFTRSQSGINIPSGITQVRVRAHDIVDGFGGQEILIDLEKDSGPGFEVER